MSGRDDASYCLPVRFRDALLVKRPARPPSSPLKPDWRFGRACGYEIADFKSHCWLNRRRWLVDDGVALRAAPGRLSAVALLAARNHRRYICQAVVEYGPPKCRRDHHAFIALRISRHEPSQPRSRHYLASSRSRGPAY